jgi:predicted ester cyclase
MSTDERGAMVQRFVDEINKGNLDVIDELLTTEFYSYVPFPGEPTATEAFREFAEELRSGAPDYHIRMYDVVDEGIQVRGCMELTGTYSGTYWGLPGSGKSFVMHIPEIALRLLFNGLQLEEKPCSHLDLIQVTEPTTDVCEQCVASGDVWPALRMCLVCGFTGCCDTSVNKHMKKHSEETGHPIFRSVRKGEAWIWCYEDNCFLSSRHLAR